MPPPRLSTLVRRMRADVPAGDGLSDAELLARFARSRDEAAFELLVWRHGAMVLSACRRVLRQAEDAEDAFQAVFLVLARKARGVSRGAALPAWLHRVAVRVAARLAASRRATTPLEVDPLARTEPDATARDELCGLVDEEIDRLPERFRRAVVLCYLEGMSAAEAALRLGCPAGTVESRLANARRRLRAALMRRGVTLPAALASSGVLAPEVVARTTKAAAAFARGGTAVGIANESSVRMAQGVLVMWQTRTWAAVAALVALAVAVTAGVGWTESPAPQPPAQPRSADAPGQPTAEPLAKADGPPDPRFGKEWWGEPIDFGNSGRGLLKAISPDGRRAIVYHNLGMVCVDLAESKIVWYRDMKEVWPLYTAAFSADGKLVATAEGDNGANLYDAATGRPLELYAVAGERNERPCQAGFLPDGRLVVLFQGTRHKPEPGKPAPPEGTRPEDNTISFSLVVWDPTTRKEVRRAHEEQPQESLRDVSWRLVGRDLLMESRTVWYEKKYQPTKQVLRYTDPRTGKAGPEVAVEKDDGNTLGISPDGKTVIAMTPGETPRLLDRATGRVLARLEGHKRPVTDAAYSPDGKLIATVSGGTPEHYNTSDPNKRLPDGPSELMIRDAAGAVMVRYQYSRTSYEFGKLDFGPDGKYLLVSTGWRDRMWAFGELPFPRPKADERVGIPTIPMPEAAKPAPTAALPPPQVPPPASGGLVADALDKLAEELPKSGRPAAQQIDALFLAALGRLPTAAELKKVNEKYRGRSTPDVYRAILADLAKSSEFEAHVRTLEKRLPGKPPAQPKWDGWPGYPSGPGTNPIPPAIKPGGEPKTARDKIIEMLNPPDPSAVEPHIGSGAFGSPRKP